VVEIRLFLSMNIVHLVIADNEESINIAK